MLSFRHGLCGLLLLAPEDSGMMDDFHCHSCSSRRECFCSDVGMWSSLRIELRTVRFVDDTNDKSTRTRLQYKNLPHARKHAEGAAHGINN